MTTNEVHRRHLAEALEHFYDQHSDNSRWTLEEWRWHDLLVARINEEDGTIED